MNRILLTMKYFKRNIPFPFRVHKIRVDCSIFQPLKLMVDNREQVSHFRFKIFRNGVTCDVVVCVQIFVGEIQAQLPM